VKLVSNASPLIFLTKIDALGWLQQCFQQTIVPPAVVAEVSMELPDFIEQRSLSDLGAANLQDQATLGNGTGVGFGRALAERLLQDDARVAALTGQIQTQPKRATTPRRSGEFIRRVASRTSPKPEMPAPNLTSHRKTPPIKLIQRS
jgi:hypothetical protein